MLGLPAFKTIADSGAREASLLDWVIGIGLEFGPEA